MRIVRLRSTRGGHTPKRRTRRQRLFRRDDDADAGDGPRRQRRLVDDPAARHVGGGGPHQAESRGVDQVLRFPGERTGQDNRIGVGQEGTSAHPSGSPRPPRRGGRRDRAAVRGRACRRPCRPKPSTDAPQSDDQQAIATSDYQPSFSTKSALCCRWPQGLRRIGPGLFIASCYRTQLGPSGPLTYATRTS